MEFWTATPLSLAPAALCSSTIFWANAFTSEPLPRSTASRDRSTSAAFIRVASFTKSRSPLLTFSATRPDVPAVSLLAAGSLLHPAPNSAATARDARHSRFIAHTSESWWSVQIRRRQPRAAGSHPAPPRATLLAGEPLGFGGGVDGRPFDHGDDDRGDGVAPVLLDLRRPGRRERADGGHERLARGDVVGGARAPVHVLRAEIAQRLAQAVYFAEVPDDQRERGLEMPLQVRQIGREQRAQGRRRAEELLIEPRRELPSLGRQRRVAALDALDGFRCHNSPSLP